MLAGKIRESLTVRIFLITCFILLGAGGVTFGLIAWATPISYTAVVSEDVLSQMDVLAADLSQTDFNDCAERLDRFILTANADILLLDENGRWVDTGSRLSSPYAEGENTTWVMGVESTLTIAPAEDSWFQVSDVLTSGDTAFSIAGKETLYMAVTFADRTEVYDLYVTPRLQAENQAVSALRKVAPGLLLVLLIFSLLCAWIYSRYITRPIVGLSATARRMAELDFEGQCWEGRRDEIGVLGRSLNQMSRRLSAALEELKNANDALRSDMEQERELERQRLAFFSAASHELKTPVTILKGQLTGMLDGVGVYRDRDKYLARSLQAALRMEGLVREILTVSRMESGGGTQDWTPVELSALAEEQLELDLELLEQRGLRLSRSLAPGLWVRGDRSLLAKALGNVISNGALYSPEGAELLVSAWAEDGTAVLTVENTGAHIGEEALPRLFEAFYREEQSRSRLTGGSGLGLYLVRIILDRHRAAYHIENTGRGVRFTARLPLLPPAEPAA